MHRRSDDTRGVLQDPDHRSTPDDGEFKWRFHETKGWQVYGNAYGTPGIIASKYTIGKGMSSLWRGNRYGGREPSQYMYTARNGEQTSQMKRELPELYDEADSSDVQTSPKFNGELKTNKKRYYVDCAGFVREALLHSQGETEQSDGPVMGKIQALARAAGKNF